jgi:hypothetical protein
MTGTTGCEFATLEARTLFSAGAAAEPETFVPPPAPVVVGARFDASRAPHSIKITFEENVWDSLDGTDLVVFNETGRFIVPAGCMTVNWDFDTNTASFEFVRLDQFENILPEGNWHARLLGEGVEGAGGTPMEQDFMFDFNFLRGDANGDGAVNKEDFDILSANFGNTNATFYDGDFNYDGTVDSEDFNLLLNHFGTAATDFPGPDCTEGPGGSTGSPFGNSKIASQETSDEVLPL